MKLRISACAALLLFASCSGDPRPPSFDAVTRSLLERRLAALAMEGEDFVAGERLADRLSVAAFYAGPLARGPAWQDPRSRDAALLVIAESASHGLVPADYHAGTIDWLLGDGTPQGVVELDLLLTDGVLSLATHLSGGKVDPLSGAPRWSHDPNAVATVRDALVADRLAGTFAALAEHGGEYEALRAELARTRDPARERALRASLERLRWEGTGPPARRIDVNLAAFELTLRDPEHATQVCAHRVMVGTTSWATPVMSSRVQSVVLNPTWTVPRKIFEEELIHKIRADPAWLSRDGVDVLRGGVRVEDLPPSVWLEDPERLPFDLVQRAGPANPLGRVKLHFPNADAIYLHDTPMRGLFSREQRTFTHGCIRVERAMELAAELLEVDESDLLELADGGETVALALARPVPIFVRYRTAAADPNGSVVVHDDVYGLDEPVLQALDAW